MNLKGIGIYLTYQCNASCSHCAYGSEPSLKNVIDEKDVEVAFETINQLGQLQTVKILGGEPTLYMERLLRVIELARTYGATNIIVITSGWWGKRQARAQTIVTSLKQAGLSLLLISVDSFHTQYIPLEHVKGAVQAAADGGMRYCVLMNLLESIHADNQYDRQTREMIQELLQLSIPIVPGKVTYLGRAVELLSPMYQGERTLPTRCPLPPFLDSFAEPSGIAIDPLGYVTLCHGIAIGNMKERPLADILTEYELEKHPILNAIMKEGPLGLMKLPHTEGFKLKEGYIDSCHLCYELRSHLRQYYPDLLAPGNHYAGAPGGCGIELQEDNIRLEIS